MALQGVESRPGKVRLPFSGQATYNGPSVASGDVFLLPGFGFAGAGPPIGSDSSCLSISPLQD